MDAYRSKLVVTKARLSLLRGLIKTDLKALRDVTKARIRKRTFGAVCTACCHESLYGSLERALAATESLHSPQEVKTQHVKSRAVGPTTAPDERNCGSETGEPDVLLGIILGIPGFLREQD